MPLPGDPTPLAGLVVVELASGLAANFAGVLLADFGARVIKIEPVAGGDPLRRAGRFAGEEDSLYFQTESRGKESVAIDLTSPAGRELARQLMEKAGAVIEDLGAGGLENLGLGPEVLAAANPSLCFLRLSGFGQTGPLSPFSADDRIAQAFSGALYVNGYPDAPPEPISVPIAEYWSGLTGAIGLLMAIHATRAGHPGQTVDLALYEPLLRFQEEMVIQYDLFGTIRERMGNEYAEIVPSNHYETADGRWVAISAANDRAFQRILEAMDRLEWATDPRVATPSARCENRQLTNQIIQEWVARHTAEEVMAAMDAKSAPAAAIYSVAETVKDPQVVHRQNIVPVPTSDGGSVCMQGVVPRILDVPVALRPAPRLGQHTEVVLRTVLGLDDGTLEQLARDGVIGRA